MNRFVVAVLMLVFVLAGAPPVLAQRALGYELKVKGMVCAFCAYNVSKQLRSADGVAPESIRVDLEKGTIALRSAKPLNRARLAALVEAAGFALEGVTEKSPDPPRPARRAERAPISLTLDANKLDDGEFDALLQALGVLASQRSAGVTVVAPAQLEMRALRPILMGRTPAIPVDFSEESRPDTIRINVYFVD